MEGKNKRTIIMLVILVALLGLSYPYLSKNWKSPGPESLAVSDGLPQVSAALSQIQGIRLDLTILQNSTFKMLKDYTLSPLNMPVGKDNPFK